MHQAGGWTANSAGAGEVYHPAVHDAALHAVAQGRRSLRVLAEKGAVVEGRCCPHMCITMCTRGREDLCPSYLLRAVVWMRPALAS